jgi:branched-chain amino acid transport system ATP-binding protein
MSEPLFEVDESGEDVTRAQEAAAGAAELSPAEKAATREEHLRLAEGALVRADDLVAGYVPGVNILRGADFYLQDGELVGIIGPNGAGKSTLLKALFGLIPVRSGKVTLRGEDITSAPAHRLVSLGVGYVPQNNNVFPSLTIEENMQMGVYLRPKTFAERFDYVIDLFPLLGERRKGKAGSLSGGERQMVAMGRALMMSPSVLLLDEPSAGLAPAFVDAIFEKTQEINHAGVTIVMVEQNARRALAMSDRGYVLDLGRDRFEGRGQELLDDPKVAELYLGGTARIDQPDTASE